MNVHKTEWGWKMTSAHDARTRMLLAHVLIIEIVAVAMIFLYGRIDYTKQPFCGWDLKAYRTMAQASPGLAADVSKPFAYRIVGPYVAGLLPLDDPAAFYVLAVAFSLCLATVFYGFLCYEGVEPNTAMIATILLIFNKYWFGFNVWNPFQINDLLSLLLLPALFWTMWREKWLAYAFLMLVGVAARETVLLMMPVAFVYLWEKRKPRSQWQAALAATAPALAAFVLLRAFVPVGGGKGLSEALLIHVRKIGSPDALFQLLVNPLLPLSLLPLVFLEDTISFFRARKHALLFVALVFASTFFGSDRERLMAPAFVVAYLLIAKILERMRHEKAFIGILLAASFLTAYHPTVTRFPLPGARSIVFAAWIGVLLAVTAVSIGYRGRRGLAEESGIDADWSGAASESAGQTISRAA
jgi:hypothetical protein